MLLIVVIILIIGGVLILGAAQRRYRQLRAVCANLLITYGVIVLMLVGGELFFRYGYAESDGMPTLASRNWLDRYWRTNSLGYRDREWTTNDWAGKTTVIAVGDSLTAGWGIENPDDRWTGVLARQLGEDYAVINLGEPGATTVGELENLRTFPLQTPDIVIWQYTLNDIDEAALSIGLDPGLNPFATAPVWATESYLGSFLYWRLASRETRGTDTYTNWLYSMFDHAVVWEIHQGHLSAVLEHVEESGAQPLFVIFPDMLNPFGSIPYVDRVAQFFEARGYAERVIKLFDAAEAMSLNERIVSPRDAHPSAAFSRVVGDLIYARMIELGLADGA